MSDTWSSIQAHKKQLDSLRERLQRRRKQDPLDPTPPRTSSPAPPPPSSSSPPPSSSSSVTSSLTSSSRRPAPDDVTACDPALERRLLLLLADPPLPLPADAEALCRVMAADDVTAPPPPRHAVESLLQKFAAQELIEVRRGLLAPPTDDVISGSAPIMVVTYADRSKLSAMMMTSPPAAAGGRRRKAEQDGGVATATMGEGGGGGEGKEGVKRARKMASDVDLEIESLLSQQSTKEQQSKKVSQEILELLHSTTAKEQSMVDKFRSRGRAQVQEFCEHGTKEECVRGSGGQRPCPRLHFRRIINKHTDESLGDCSFLNTCFHMDTCKYVHYEIDAGPIAPPHSPPHTSAPRQTRTPPPKELVRPPGGSDAGADRLFPPQWICCDIRYLDVSILGKFSVVMADPPWDIHMELPYGTLTDDEMRRLNIPGLQDEGFLFLWVTGRAMELGRECLNLWGYERVDEIIWVKTNQLQRIIRTGRTGHWLNHGKEHCLVGVKGNPQGFNRGLDCDVIVAEVRSTSHKPDEIYGMIERLSPGTRKIELFGRPHNVQPNWITLGNQLDGIHLLDPDVVAHFKRLYPDGVISKPKNL
ncbi:N6-adenosine-methyltransferase catalytic subunit-like [Neopsephotus bourkii]|uniref:N6-adenosine-methyltransferase catalytic subunit-like n=1 Tax=Neopsephotus bourkii TaxID=309878 RepID=UPI002AA58BAF|nr:N6-adenosine-methyltransferase catalytic subunit-like [Neopsephotus bourkii]